MSAATLEQAAMPRPSQLHAIAREANAAFTDRADNCHPSEWSDYGRWRAYVAMLRTGRAWACPRTGRVVASVSGPDARGWAYVCGEVLDTAMDRAGLWDDGASWDNARIDDYPRDGMAVLRF